MTLDQLRYFQAVCKYGSVSRGAESLNISQPSVSNAISNLEKEFGVALFTRQHKRFALTEEGALFSEMAEGLLNQADALTRTMETLEKKNKVLRIGVPPMIGSLVLPLLFGEHMQAHTSVQVRVVEDSAGGLKRLLADNQIDMAFLPHTQPFGGDWCAEPLTELQNVCCVNKAHPLAGKRSVRLECLADEPMVLFKNSFFQTERILEAFSHMSRTPNVLLDTEQLSTVQNMIAGNTAIGFLFAFLVKSMPELVAIPLDPPMTTRVSLVWKKDRRMSDDMKSLITFMKKAISRVGDTL